MVHHTLGYKLNNYRQQAAESCVSQAGNLALIISLTLALPWRLLALA